MRTGSARTASAPSSRSSEAELTPSVFDKPQGPKRILAIDGGGMRGALAVGILAKLEATLRQKLGRPDMVLADYFDLIGGTSTGAIIAAGLALGKDTEYLRDLYNDLGRKIFRQWMPRLWLIQSRFDPKKLAKVIDDVLGDITLGDAPWRTGFAAISKRVDRGSVWILTNCPRDKYWEGSPSEIEREPDPARRKITPNRDYRLATIVRASAAAPFYFDMVKLQVVRDEPGVFFDGAMTPHGNPALQLTLTALIPAYGLGWKPELDGLNGWKERKDKVIGWEAGADNLLVVSVGTGQPRPEKRAWQSRQAVPAFEKALHALTSIAYDNSQLGITILQWLGESPRPWKINNQIETLTNSRPGIAPLWTFLRYDAPLEDAWLQEHLHKSYSPRALARLTRMDDDRQVDELYALGELAGETLIRADDFPGVFNPDPPATAS
jgi:uncharacterized protein